MAPKVKLNLKDRLEDGELDLSLTDLQEVPVKEIAAVKKVTSLDLSNNRLTNLGKNFITLTTIIKLDLSKNQLTELPDDFGSMKQLRHLDLYSNELKHLPLSFYQLKSLKWLDLKNNPLVPAVAKIAGPCIDAGQCVKCAKDVVAFFSQLHEDVELEKQKREQTKQLELQAELEHQKQVQKKKDKKKAAKAKKNKTKLDNKTEEIDPIQIQQVPKTPPLKKEQIQKTKTSSYSGVLFKLVLFTFITAFLLSTTKQDLGLYVKQTTVAKWDSLQRNLPDTLQPWALSFERNIHTIHNVTGLYMDTMVKYVNDISNGPVMHRFSTGLQHILKTTLKESERFYYFVSDKCNFIVNEIKNKIN